MLLLSHGAQQTSHTCEVAITAAAEKGKLILCAPLDLEPIFDDKRQFAELLGQRWIAQNAYSDGSLTMLTAMDRWKWLQRWIA